MAILDDLRGQLVDLCVEHGLLDREVALAALDLDLIESGVIDSTGIATLKAIIEETWAVDIPEPLFIAELRTISRVAEYLEKKVQEE